MGNILTQNFTGTNGDLWTTTLGFVKAYGGAGDAIIGSNKGEAGSTATERIYLVPGYPGIRDYKFQGLFDWINAAGSGRRHGIGVRCTSDGKYGYLFEVDSNVGVTRARLRKISNGTFSDVVAWTTITGTPYSIAAADLNAGATLQLRVENTDASTVSLKATINAISIFDTTDSSATAIFSGGTASVIIGPNCTGTDVTTDDLALKDFEDENTASSPALGSGLDLIIDGTHYTQAEWVALGIVVEQSVVSYDTVPAITLRDEEWYTAPALTPGQTVTVAYAGTVLASGIIRRRSRGLDGSEGASYEVTGWHELASEVPILDPTFKGQFATFNVNAKSEYYLAARADQELGQIIAWVLDNHLDGDGGLRDVGAAPASGAAYVQADLDALDFVGNDINISGTVLQAIESLLAYMPSYAVYIDPDTKQWRFRHRPTLTQKDVDLAAAFVEGSIAEDLTANYTKVRVTGTRPEATSEDLSLLGAGIAEAWEAGLEATYDQEKRWKNKDTGTVSSKGTDGGFITMDPASFTMGANEWKRGLLTFSSGAESGNSYGVQSNTTGTFKFWQTAWVAGGPAATDGFTVEGNGDDPDGLDAGHTQVGRLFELSSLDKGIAGGSCVPATIEHSLPNGGSAKIPVTAKINTPNNTALKSSIELSLPAIGLFNPLSATKQDLGCDVDATLDMAADVQVTVPTFSRSDPSVPTFDEPTLGFYGTAYTADSGKWSGGGQPGVGDPGVKRILPWSAPGYQDSTDETAYRKAAVAILELYSTLNRSVRIRIDGIDTSWADLDFRLTLSHTGGDLTGEESATDLWPIAVEYNYEDWTTTIVVGTLGNGQYNLEALRERFVGTTKRERLLRYQDDLIAMYECLSSVVNGGGEVGRQDPLPVCAEQVAYYSSTRNATVSIDIKIEDHKKALDGIADIIEMQKGGSFATTDGVITYQNATGDIFELRDDGWHHTFDSGGAPVPGEPLVSTMWSSLDDLASDRVEGKLWNAIKGILANLGKTADPSTGEVEDQDSTGTKNGSAGSITYGRDSAGNVVETPLGVNPIPRNVIDWLKANLGKTEDPKGGVKKGGASVGTAGATLWGHDDLGDIQAIALVNTDTTPGTKSQGLEETTGGLFGMDVSDAEDPIGPVWSDG